MYCTIGMFHLQWYTFDYFLLLANCIFKCFKMRNFIIIDRMVQKLLFGQLLKRQPYCLSDDFSVSKPTVKVSADPTPWFKVLGENFRHVTIGFEA